MTTARCTSNSSLAPDRAEAAAPDRTRRAALAAAGASVCAPLLGACATLLDATGPALPPAGEPRFVAPPPDVHRHVALVLSSGAARGFAHLGLLRVLEREGLRPDLVVGTSAGAIVGAMYASGHPAARIERSAAEMDWTMLFDFDPLRALLGGSGLGIVPGLRLERYLRQQIAAPMQSFPIPFAAVAADMESGAVVALNHGDAAIALRASSAVPGVYAPVRAGGRLLADGQLVSPLPVATARRLGAFRTIACDVVYPPQHAEIASPLAMLFQALIVSTWQQVLAERAMADLVIAPEIRTTRQLGLGSREWLIRAGEQAAMAQLPSLRKLFDAD